MENINLKKTTTRNIRAIVGAILFILGICITYVMFMQDPNDAAAGYLLTPSIISFPLIIIGGFLLLSAISTTGTIIASIGLLISILLGISSLYNYRIYTWFSDGLLALGFLYGLVEGIIKLVKFFKTNFKIKNKII